MATVEFDEFPKDNRLWVIRWIDKINIPNDKSETPTCSIWLTTIDSDEETEWKQFKSATFDSQIVWVSIGATPILNIGDVYRNGILLRNIGLYNSSMRFSLWQRQLTRVDSKVLDKPSWWGFRDYFVLNRSEFALFKPNMANFVRSFCVLLQNQQCTLVIPSFVIFKTFFAPTSEFAIALTSGSWKDNKRAIVMPDDTFIRDDGNWEVRLALKIANDYKQYAGLLCVDEFGYSCAKTIHSHLTIKTNDNSIKADIPFRNNTIMDLNFEYIILSKNPYKLLCTKITGATWPKEITQRIHYWRETDSRKGAKQTPTDKPKPFSNRAKLADPPKATIEGSMPNNSRNDPLPSSQETRFQNTGFNWIGSVEEVNVPKETSNIYADDESKVEVEQKSSTSFGNPHQGETNSAAAKAELNLNNRHNENFARLTRMFASMKEQNLLNRWGIVKCPDYKQFRNGYSVWNVPGYYVDYYGDYKKYPWAFFDRSLGIIRSVLICHLTTITGSLYLWFELEFKGNGGYSSLVIKVTDKGAYTRKFINEILQLAVDVQGRWRKAKDDLPAEHGYWNHQMDNDGEYKVESAKAMFARYFGEVS